MPVLSQFDQQLGAEHDIAISAALAALDMKDHALAVHIPDFQARELGTSQTRGIESHQQSSTESSVGGVDELGDFFLTEYRGQAMDPFGIGRVGDAPALPERLDVEKTQSCQVPSHRTR